MKIIDIIRGLENAVKRGIPWRRRKSFEDPDGEPQVMPGVSEGDRDFILSTHYLSKFADREFYGPGAEAAYERRAIALGLATPETIAAAKAKKAKENEKREAKELKLAAKERRKVKAKIEKEKKILAKLKRQERAKR